MVTTARIPSRFACARTEPYALVQVAGDTGRIDVERGSGRGEILRRMPGQRPERPSPYTGVFSMISAHERERALAVLGLAPRDHADARGVARALRDLDAAGADLAGEELG